MSVWIKEGCCGDLIPRMQKAHGKLTELYAVRGKDLYVSSRRDGKHRSGSFHYNGCAEDILDYAKIVSLLDIKHALGRDFDVVEYDWGYHVEYDPEPKP
ncbi:MAG: hypothetical protein GWN94_16835 [Phycisphaerae bacterium]|nr:hypothetical protein [Phycisphaerae bacterium]NIP53789.1 hypothetical protein [Phycisphaerae bacterium]NIS52750.1 hypothetical protein [Phycisphaerae bacterium]NIX29784.1 hypothetical protein [Phycisphaerae bacterium]